MTREETKVLQDECLDYITSRFPNHAIALVVADLAGGEPIEFRWATNSTAEFIQDAGISACGTPLSIERVRRFRQ